MSDSRVRTRELPQDLGLGALYEFDEPNVALGSTCARIITQAGHCDKRYIEPGFAGTVRGKQVTASEGHPGARRLNAASGDVGGPFSTWKSYYSLRPSQGTWKSLGTPFASSIPSRSYNRFYEFRGPVYPMNPKLPAFPPVVRSTGAELNQLGTAAIERSKPGQPVTSLTNFLAELKSEGLPALPRFESWKSNADTMRQLGKDHLNYSFSWNPTVKDVTSFMYGITHAMSLIRQYERDAGRVVRRRFHFPPEISSETAVAFVEQIPSGPPPSRNFDSYGVSGGRGDILRTRTIEKRRWFSGAFTYFLPTGYDSRSALDEFASRAEVVLGTDITPEVLWNLAPWSWAVDWFANVGDVLSNVSDFSDGGLVMRYGYLMEHTITTDTYSRKEPVYYKDGPPVNSSFDLITESKTRTKANPFGFGVTWDGLSPFQLSIAAALGISKS